MCVFTISVIVLSTIKIGKCLEIISWKLSFTLSSFQSVQCTGLSAKPNPLASGLFFEGIWVGCVLVFYSWKKPEHLLEGVPWISSVTWTHFWDFKILQLSGVEDEIMRAAGKCSECFDWTLCFSRKQTSDTHVSPHACLFLLQNFKICLVICQAPRCWMSNVWIPCVELTSKPPSPCAETTGMV